MNENFQCNPPAVSRPDAESPRLNGSLLLDLEARGDAIHHIGAVLGDRVFDRKGPMNAHRVLGELDDFAEGARNLLGHNLIGHDLPVLKGIRPDLRLFRKPVVDTLFLSPLAFPENPYHRLVKGYKLVKDSLNDPVADARLAASVFRDQWGAFKALSASGHANLLQFYRFAFSGASGPEPLSGLASVFSALGAEPIDTEKARGILAENIRGQVCDTALEAILEEGFATGMSRPALAYLLSWLRVAGGNSILPPWVRHRFPETAAWLHRLRDVPCGGPSCAYCLQTHDPKGWLRQYFGFSSFREKPAAADGASIQEQIAAHGMEGLPLLAILPTGGGKSICYQLPALVRYYRRGLLTIVISPLQALMKDQVDNLAAKTGTPYATALYGLLTPPERGEVFERIRLGDVAILYVAPEQLRNPSFRKAIAQREIGSWVFDEAHCLSKWGHDFRPDYLYAGRFVREFASEQGTAVPPVACFTATAKKEVKEEILAYFRKEIGQELDLFEAGVERENLRFQVQVVEAAQKYGTIHRIVSERLSENLTGSAIVYASTRREAADIAEYLTGLGHAAGVFHGGLNPAEKRAVQEAFVSGEIRVVAATNAFGMGIDKEDVRLVVHADIPGSLESYLQEAGRAGRDLRDAECVLLYNSSDIETQFKLEALSSLRQNDIVQILRSIRRACKDPEGHVALTAGEILRDDSIEVSFESGDAGADTKVRTAIAWLERAKFLERNENRNQVFQGKPLVKNLEEARRRISGLNLPQAQKRRFLAVLGAFMNVPAGESLSADSLAELSEFYDTGDPPGAAPASRASDRVIRTLNGMAEAGLIEKGIVLSAFVRHKVKNSSQDQFRRVVLLEREMLKILRETEPDAFDLGWIELSLRKLNQNLKGEGFETNPAVLRGLLKSLSLDGKGLAGTQGSLQYCHLGMDRYRVKLLRDWEALQKTAERRQSVSEVVLGAILSRIPADAPPNAETLVSFSSEDLSRALRSHLYLSQEVRDPLAAIERGLLFLHEQKVVILQQGLAVFRQAMNIRLLPEARKRRYTKADYNPLSAHFAERVFQVHVMNEYARLGARKIGEALEFVLTYFTMEKADFVRRYFAHRKDVLQRATGEESYRKIVDALENPAQIEVVTADEDANMLILAGPGSGKTRVVVHRCAYLIRVLRVPPESILVACFNHHAAVSLKERLRELLGDDARRVMVQTYHGMAMRLTGSSLAEVAQRGEEPAFDALIPEAVRLLKGEADLPGIQGDEVRDRLLAAFRYILVDEYQDIDEEQYELISALAGRTESDPDSRLSILAVGDDDQNIYAFRGTNVRFIRRFQEDYRARIHCLVENYRSTAHIVSAANALIAHNRDRMKDSHPIRCDGKRRDDQPGGPWSSLDPLSRGRVQLIEVDGAPEQAGAVCEELRRLRELKPALQWSDVAVLSRTRENLAPVRSLLEHLGIPLSWPVDRAQCPPLHRLREAAKFLEFLQGYRDEILPASDLEAHLDTLSGGVESPWWELLREVLSVWKAETGNAAMRVTGAVDALYESLAATRREQRLGRGVFLSTLHGAKGMEFPHVFILDGDWSKRNANPEEERRILYVGMTRARETLTLFQRRTGSNPYLASLNGEFVFRRTAGAAVPVPEKLNRLRYEILGMKDVYLGYAGRFSGDDPIHGHLARLAPGSRLRGVARAEKVELQNDDGRCVAVLSGACARQWGHRVPDIESIRVLGMVRRERSDETGEFEGHCQAESWEFPWAEIVYLSDGR
ncbi:MAG: RecQ family ATP-dependent DNA helicase [Syntrophobacteraceae bacterium]